MKTDADRLGFELVRKESTASQKNNFQDENSPERRIARNAEQVAILYKGQKISFRYLHVQHTS